MAIIEMWPPSLPQDLRLPDHQLSAPTLPPLKTDMQAGNARMRRQYSVQVATFRVSWLLTAERTAVFETWFRDTLLDGTKHFYHPKIPLVAGGFGQRECWFPDLYSAVPSGPKGGRLVSANLNVLGR